jgi:hypothetical protein
MYLFQFLLYDFLHGRDIPIAAACIPVQNSNELATSVVE